MKSERQKREEFAEKIMKAWDEAHGEPERPGLEGNFKEEIRGQKVAKSAHALSDLVTSELLRVRDEFWSREEAQGIRRKDGGRSMREACCASGILDMIEEWEE